ncbi:hypothetical protein FRC02_005800 [Tulasnella sp. 418]|nr:hypothetical protein FRC02_005800 [Tulasnella sp. 418]
MGNGSGEVSRGGQKTKGKSCAPPKPNVRALFPRAPTPLHLKARKRGAGDVVSIEDIDEDGSGEGSGEESESSAKTKDRIRV